MDTNQNQNNKMDFGLSRLIKIAGSKKFLIFFSSFYAIMSEIFALVPFFVIYLITVELISPPIEFQVIWNLLWIAFVAIVARFILKYISSMLSHIAAFNILYELRIKLTKHLGDLNMGYFNLHNTGYIKKVLGEDVERIETFVAHQIPDFASAIAIPIITIIFLFFFDWRMALISLIPIPLAILGWSGAFFENKGEMGSYHAAMERMNGTIIEYVRGMQIVKIFNQTVESFTRFKTSVIDFRNFCNEWTMRSIGPYSLFLVLLGSSLVFILPSGVWFYLQGTLELPVLILFLIVGVAYVKPLYYIIFVSGVLAQITEGVNRIEKILSEEGISKPKNPKTPDKYTVEFCGVDFFYDKSKVLNDISFKIEEGQLFALVGPSGSGKTTIANLTARLWDVQKGSIRIGDVDIKDIPIDVLMEKMSLVFQDVFIFSDSVYENIKIGRKDASFQEIVEAAKAANIHDFIVEELTDGYQTRIGEAGVHLSGGEKQRISLARAILKDSPIIVLDEATAFADPENEGKIQEAFSKLIKDKTVLIIAHRLSTITDSDQIMVINNGRIVEKGTHTELIKNKGLYKEMWDSHTSAKQWKLKSDGDTDV